MKKGAMPALLPLEGGAQPACAPVQIDTASMSASKANGRKINFVMLLPVPLHLLLPVQAGCSGPEMCYSLSLSTFQIP